MGQCPGGGDSLERLAAGGACMMCVGGVVLPVVVGGGEGAAGDADAGEVLELLDGGSIRRGWWSAMAPSPGTLNRSLDPLIQLLAAH